MHSNARDGYGRVDGNYAAPCIMSLTAWTMARTSSICWTALKNSGRCCTLGLSHHADYSASRVRCSIWWMLNRTSSVWQYRRNGDALDFIKYRHIRNCYVRPCLWRRSSTGFRLNRCRCPSRSCHRPCFGTLVCCILLIRSTRLMGLIAIRQGVIFGLKRVIEQLFSVPTDDCWWFIAISGGVETLFRQGG